MSIFRLVRAQKDYVRKNSHYQPLESFVFLLLPLTKLIFYVLAAFSVHVFNNLMITWYFLLKFNTTSKCAAASQGFHKICLNTALDLCSEHHRQFLISSYNLDSPGFYQGSFRVFPVDHLPWGCTDQLSKSSVYSRKQRTDTCVLCTCIERGMVNWG